MKKVILTMSLIVCLIVSGCCPFYDLSNFVVPDDSEFIAIIKGLDTPKKICAYTRENFTWQLHLVNYSPYQTWLVNTRANTGDCNDIGSFIIFVANYCGYKTYQMWIGYKGTVSTHYLGIFVEKDSYTYSSNQYYHPIYADSFKEIALDYCRVADKELKFYKVYDYNNNLVKGE